MYAWPDIESLAHVLRWARKYRPDIRAVDYRAKPKLDGTNAAVQIMDGAFHAAQSRTQVITPENDNMGFARWANAQNWSLIPPNPGMIIIHGEWAGKGIQKGTSISNVGSRGFYIFAVEIASTAADPETGDWIWRVLITDPDAIQALIGGAFLDAHPDIRILPWYGDVLTLDVLQPEPFSEQVEAVVATFDRCDPYVKETLGVEGHGEGVVYYPILGTSAVKRSLWGHLAFKAKGEKHRVKKEKVAAPVNFEVLQGIQEFTQAFVTEARLQQGLGVATQGAGPEMKHIGAFLKWMSQDVLKESKVELAESGLTWEQVNKAVTAAARQWFIQQVG